MTIEKLRKLVVEEGTDDGHVTVPNCKELLRHERNKTIDEVAEKLNPLVEFGFVDVPWTEVTKILESLKL